METLSQLHFVEVLRFSRRNYIVAHKQQSSQQSRLTVRFAIRYETVPYILSHLATLLWALLVALSLSLSLSLGLDTSLYHSSFCHRSTWWQKVGSNYYRDRNNFPAVVATCDLSQATSIVDSDHITILANLPTPVPMRLRRLRLCALLMAFILESTAYMPTMARRVVIRCRVWSGSFEVPLVPSMNTATGKQPRLSSALAMKNEVNCRASIPALSLLQCEASSWGTARSWRVSTSKRASPLHFALSTQSTDQLTLSDVEDTISYNKTLQSEWNVPELKKQVTRRILRCHKKVSKASQRLSQMPDDSQEEARQIQNELDHQQQSLQSLNQLESLLSNFKSKGNSVVLPEEMASLAILLQVDDGPSVNPQPRGDSKPKGPRSMSPSRLPYRRYYAQDGTEIRVGKKATDNDELTLNRQHRDDADWWMHAAGCPGSHVVIRSNLSVLPKEVMADAAALAARQSKCYSPSVANIKVSLTRCRDIKKPPGAKAGLVQLVGKVQSVTVNMREATKRLERLDATVKVN
jgi:NFACT protein RNA binding domain